MTNSTRVFILGAGFSKPAGMPLPTEVLPLIAEELKLDENDDMRTWLDDLRERLVWLSEAEGQADSFAMNVEEVFHYAHFDIEAHRLSQQLEHVGRGDGPETEWNNGESIVASLLCLEEALRDVILKRDNASDLAPIKRWAEGVREGDAILTFNYDTLAERALAALNRPWNHGIESRGDNGVSIFKLHGSIDWIVAHRSESFSKLDLLFDKPNANRLQRDTGSVEDDYRLWRFRSREVQSEWIEGRDLQWVPSSAAPRTIGIAGLGAYKELHRVPGLGPVWVRGMRALYKADLAVVVGFSMSDFDRMAQMQFAEVARARRSEGRPLPLIVIDPFAKEAAKDRFRRVFRFVEFVEKNHETVDWTSLG